MVDIDNTLMLKTLFKLLEHDTRNTFLKLNALVSDLDDSPIKDMITDSVHELFDLIASSSGFLDGKKRIQSMYDIISDLNLTSDKIKLTNHHRVKMMCDAKIYLFVEVSELFNHAMLNIIENALKYSPEEENVVVEIKREDNMIVVLVKDRGIGIANCDRDTIFKQGFRAENALEFNGTGTGLWITQNIIKQDSGTIEVYENSGGIGTVFKVTVPSLLISNLEESMDIIINNYVDDPTELDDSLESVKMLIDMHNPPEEYHYDSLVFANLLNFLRKEKRNKTESHFKEKLLAIKAKNPDGKKVIIVDDSTYVHYYLGSFFTQLGYHVCDFAYNGLEGFNLYETYNPDIVTLDITMPVMSGLEASEKILEFDPNANMLFLSGLGDHKGLKESINSKLKGREYGILSKPFKIDDLKESLKSFKTL